MQNLIYLAVRVYRGKTSSFDSFSLVDKSTLSIKEINFNKVNLVANTNVTDQIIFGEKSFVKIYNTNGQIVKSVLVNKNQAVDVSNLPKGVYLVSGEVDGRTITQKIIKR